MLLLIDAAVDPRRDAAVPVTLGREAGPLLVGLCSAEEDEEEEEEEEDEDDEEAAAMPLAIAGRGAFDTDERVPRAPEAGAEDAEG